MHSLLAPFQRELFEMKKTAAHGAGSSAGSPGPDYHDELTSSSVVVEGISQTRTYVDQR